MWEEISRGIAAGWPARVIARRIGRTASAVCREVARNGGGGHRPVVADSAAFERARRPKPSKLATDSLLRGVARSACDDRRP
ncbi:helix-turn-helix domain-containing protein [Nocardia jiangsuensis]|uniref:Helix-turn-helix domain-containing protein n=1 Tax=Nocardia jiangsuensis TaxID=1691563 RepID=A0ABV8E2P9_9NOCA